jgi:phosphate ABC transporter, permease protein PstA
LFRRIYKENLGKVLSWLSAGLTLLLCVALILYIFVNGITHINLEFLFTDPNPSMDEATIGGIMAPIIGTILLTFIGILFALPWSLATAVYLSEYSERNRFAKYFRLGIDVLSGVPTIVIAIFGLAIFSNPAFGFMSSMVEGVEGVNRAFGRSFLVAGLTMSVMILPFMIKTFEEALKVVPQSYREGSLAMGASKWHTIVKIIIPSSKNGIITGTILGMGRIIGDTAIVWLTLGGSITMTGIKPWWAHIISTLRNTGSTLTSYIYFTSPAGELNMPGVAFGASFVLIVIILVLNLVTDFIGSLNKTVKEE